MSTPRSEGSGSNHRAGRWFWGGFIVIILIGLLLALFAALRSAQQWAEARLEQAESIPPIWSEVIRVTLGGGEKIDIDPHALPAIRSETASWLAQRRLLAQQQIIATDADWQQHVVQPVLRRVPVYADWYYSLKGEYQRLLHAAMGDLPQFVAHRLDALLLQPAGSVESIERYRQALSSRLEGQMGEAVNGLQQLVVRLVKDHRRQTPEGSQVRVVGDWRIDNRLGENLEPFLRLDGGDLTRQGVASAAGAVVAAAATKKLAAATVAKLSAAGQGGGGAAALAAGKLGAKSAVKAAGGAVAGAGAGAGAASGAALCGATLVGLPLAPGCALVGGVISGIATWLLLDKAILEADELLNRAAFEADLRAALSSQLSAAHEALNSEYSHLVNAGFDGLQQEFNRSLTPAGRQPAMDFVPAHGMPRPDQPTGSGRTPAPR